MSLIKDEKKYFVTYVEIVDDVDVKHVIESRGYDHAKKIARILERAGFCCVVVRNVLPDEGQSLKELDKLSLKTSYKDIVEGDISDKITFNDLASRLFAVNKAKGWATSGYTFLEKIALIHAELSEAAESFMKHEPPYRHDSETGKPEGFIAEIVDVITMSMNILSSLDVDIAKALLLKNEYNKTRPKLHGKVKRNEDH
jgi:hypothetical protein